MLATIAHAADGDARLALNILEIALSHASGALLTKEDLMQVLGTQYRRFDQGGDLFFDQISALHKSVRGSDPDAALYWFARMLMGGVIHFMSRAESLEWPARISVMRIHGH